MLNVVMLSVVVPRKLVSIISQQRQTSLKSTLIVDKMIKMPHPCLKCQALADRIWGKLAGKFRAAVVPQLIGHSYTRQNDQGPVPYVCLTNILNIWHSWACIIKLIMAVIYGFHNKLECLSLNTRLNWKGLQGTNTLAYYRNCKLWP